MCVDAENIERADIGVVVEIFYRAHPIFLRNELIHSGRSGGGAARFRGGDGGGGGMEWQCRGGGGYGGGIVPLRRWCGRGGMNLANIRRHHPTAPHRATTPRRSTFREAFLPLLSYDCSALFVKTKFPIYFRFF